MRRIWLGREIVVLSLPPLDTHMPCCKYIFLESDNFSKLLCVPNALVKSKKSNGIIIFKSKLFADIYVGIWLDKRLNRIDEILFEKTLGWGNHGWQRLKKLYFWIFFFYSKCFHQKFHRQRRALWGSNYTE